MKLALLIFAVIGVTLAGPVQKQSLGRVLLDLQSKDASIRNTALEQVILDLLETLRGVMLTGTDDIPVLDPLQIQQIALDGAIIDFPGSHIELSGLTVSHLSTFEIENLSFSMTSLLQQRYTLTFDGSIPSIDINTNDYDLSVSAFGFSVFGKGEASINLIRPRLSGSAVVTLRLIGGFALSVETVDLKLELGAFESNIRGLFGDEGASDFVNLFLGHLLPDLIQFYETEISSFLNETVLVVANEILSNIDLAGIIG